MKLTIEQKTEIENALEVQKLYNPYSVFTHSPEFYESDINGYECKIHIVKWNTKSTRMSVFYARKNADKWIFRRATGLKRQRHGERIRSKSSKFKFY